MPSQEAKIFDQASQLNKALVSLIRQRIEASNGSISFSDYMQMALYTPQLGYYQNGLYKFGELGDFVTAPEISPLFAASVANALVSLPEKLTDNLLEIGAGSGQFAFDLLSHLATLNRTPTHYYILEPSASLQKVQKEKLRLLSADLYQRIIWLSELSDNFVGSILANEVVDAIPCALIEKTLSGWQQKGVTYQDGKLQWSKLTPIEEKTLPDILKQGNYSAGYTCEIRPLANAWIKSLAQSLQQGILLLFDYGYPQQDYYHVQRTQGTLQCFSRHKSNNNPLELTGLQDITAHVDFTELAKAAVNHGLSVAGFTTQAGFLLENHILDLSKEFINQDLEKNYQQSQQIQKLITPDQMGELVKVICFSKDTQTVPQGFSMQDQLNRL